jgi:phenylpyruvate tautomerase PptA (4-oxalocrotonate tautomerase family)
LAALDPMANITTSLTGCVKQSSLTFERDSFEPISNLIGVMQMPFYTAILEEGTVSTETKAKIAAEITRIHTSVMKVPMNYVRVVLSYPKVRVSR